MKTALKYLAMLALLNFAAGCDVRRAILFADDFESYKTGEALTAPWSKSGDGAAYVDSTRSHSGKNSVRLTTGEGYRNRAFIGLAGKPVFPLRNNRYYGQMYMWLDEASPDGVHWTMLQSSGTVAGRGFRADVRYGGQHRKQLMANYDTRGVKSDCWQHSTVAIPEKRWFKIAWFFDGAKNRMRFWLDDRPLGEIAVDGRGQGCLADELGGEWLFPVFENVEIGWVDYQTGGGTRNLWIDDFTISSKPFRN